MFGKHVNFNVLQLMDSAFPIGSFAHSGGLESYCGLTTTGFPNGANRSLKSEEQLNTLSNIIMCILENTTTLQVYFVDKSARLKAPDLTNLPLLEKRLHVMMSNHVAKRASLQQGKSLAAVAAVVFASTVNASHFKALHELVTHSKLLGHFPVVFGYVCGLLGLKPLESIDLFLYGQLRNLISAAVRMGLVGSVKAQKLQNDLQLQLPQLSQRGRLVVEPHISHPIFDIAQNGHDKLFAKLFNS